MVDYGKVYPVYSGTNYGFDPDFGILPDPEIGLPISHYVPTSSISTAVNARTANQLKAASDSINTGVTGVEVAMTFTDMEKAIPDAHLEEINRLRKLTGTELTLHGPMIEPTGLNPQAGAWTESQREQAEKQIWNSIERGHKIDPDGNLIVTLHASHSLPEPRTEVMTPEGKKVATRIHVIDERTGNSGPLPLPKKSHFLGQEPDVDKELARYNEESWSRALGNITLESSRAREIASRAGAKYTVNGQEINPGDLLKLSREKPQEFEQAVKQAGPEGQAIQSSISELNFADAYLRDSYIQLQELFDQAYDAAIRDKENRIDDLKKLDNFRDEASQKIQKLRNDPSRVTELSNEISRGVAVLNTIKTPQVLKPLKNFAIDKSAETFGNIAWQGYNKFKDKAPVISIENPPVGMGMSTAEELKEIIEKSRKNFIEKAKSKGSSESEAKQQAEKLIGATWDVGHINMLRKYGYEDAQLKEQTKTIAPFIKHVHLSDNFGFEHSELPMGMGNVPMKSHEELLKKYGKQVGKIKRVMEAADWVQQFQSSPFMPTLEAYGSPVFSQGNLPYWNQIAGTTGAYYSGLGLNPEIHHSIFGAGFGNLPVELGGQLPGGRSRVSGAPID